MNYLQFKHKFLLHGGGKPQPKLSVGRYSLASATIGNYAIIAGGYQSGGYSDVVDAFDADMIQHKPDPLKNARYQLAATTVGSYAIFHGGRKGSTVYKSADAYNTSLTRTTAPDTNWAVYQHAAATTGNYAIFCGGCLQGNDGVLGVSQSYNSSLTKQSDFNLPAQSYELAAVSANGSAVFGGGHNNDGDKNYCWRYNNSLSYTSLSPLSIARKQLAVTHMGETALFGGGHHDGTVYPTVDGINLTTGNRVVVEGLTKARKYLTAVTDNSVTAGKARFAGGEQNSSMDLVDTYDETMTHSIDTPLSVPRKYLTAVAIGNKTMIVGGYGGSPVYSDVIDVYTVD